MTALIRVTNDADVDDVVEIIERDGGVVVEDFAAPDTLRGLWDDLGPRLDATMLPEDQFGGTRTKRVNGLFGRTDHLTPVVTHPLYLGPARRIMQKPVRRWVGRYRAEITPSIQIGVTQAVQIMPGESKQPLHRDDTLHLRPHPGPTTRVQLMLAMSDFTADNGATLVIPGSHHWDDERRPRLEEAVPTEMPAGSALVWLGAVWHAGGRNSTDRPRTGLTIGLDLGNIRQEENQYLAVARDKVLAYPQEVQELLGYDLCPPYLGWYEMENPSTWLKQSADRS
ncbi:phytanoyl-CoA dioxygenase family protein [Actinomadura sp. KC06]|uniref:phytanoyl-CoA dioxygenase family protein n=1 Tax=Actinomadura sp. KC06 TaxID=2530369 RepID=UPI00104F7316|nr:phytanoyl-CoA dioxygenase family protein [Actinomadura sp. KC06]TDD33901.1 phytanoyl-CoA dioxygenase family protein [Actinomadura sp. KC06]